MYIYTGNQEKDNKIREQAIKEHHEDFNRFKECFVQDDCSLCKKSILNCNGNEPCLHWLLMPNGFKKKKKLYPLFEKYSFIDIQSYIRWVGAIRKPILGVNARKEEGERFSLNVTYEDIYWSILIKEADIEGGHWMGRPHYHMQIMKDKNIILKFAEHLKLEPWDIDFLSGKMDVYKGVGIGVGEEEDIDLPSLVNEMKNSKSEDESDFGIGTFMLAKDGGTISGDKISNMIKKSKKEGVSIAKIASEDEELSSKILIEYNEDKIPEKRARNKTR